MRPLGVMPQASPPARAGGVKVTSLSELVAWQPTASTATGTDAPAPITATVPEAPWTLDRSLAKSLASRFADVTQAGSPEAEPGTSATWFPFES